MTANTVNNFPLRPMKTPFAGTALISANTSSVGGINVSTLPATGDNVANVATGFPETFSTSITKGGKYIKRADVNAMGYIATIMAFRQQMGMPNEWNKQICDAIGGYPKGAVLDYCIWNGSVIQETYKITSLTDDNTEDPTTTAQANWKQWARVSVNAEYVSKNVPDFTEKVALNMLSKTPVYSTMGNLRCINYTASEAGIYFFTLGLYGHDIIYEVAQNNKPLWYGTSCNAACIHGDFYAKMNAGDTVKSTRWSYWGTSLNWDYNVDVLRGGFFAVFRCS